MRRPGSRRATTSSRRRWSRRSSWPTRTSTRRLRRGLAAFLPDLEREQPAVLFSPVTVSDRSDGKIAHLDGLNLSRAWAWRELAHRLPPAAAAIARAVAERHLDASLPHVAGDYMGEHWLATYAVLALEA